MGAYLDNHTEIHLLTSKPSAVTSGGSFSDERAEYRLSKVDSVPCGGKLDCDGFDEAMVEALRQKDVLDLRHGCGNVPCWRTFKGRR